MKMSDQFSFIEHVNDYSPKGTLLIRFSQVFGYENLMKEYYEKLEFPGYFGFNWDALSDCLRDFSWISNFEITLINVCLPELSKEDLKKYLQILSRACCDWSEGEEHKLEIVFPKSYKSKIKSLIDS